MKVIFLDVDGVIRHDLYKGPEKNHGIDPEKLKLLKELIDKTNAKIVLSSTWRRGITQTGKILNEESFNILKTILKEYKIEIYSEIPRPINTENENRISISLEDLIKYPSEDNDRAKYIVMWLESNKDVESFVILDDFDGWKKYDLEEYVVKTSQYNEGLLPNHIEKAIDILNKPKVRKR